MNLFAAFFLFAMINPFSCNNTIVNISLPKQTYKEFEPINMQFEWINKSSQNDSIWSLFSGYGDYLNVEIISEDGIKYNRKIGGGVKSGNVNVDFGDPLIVAPNNTLKKSIALNEYGKIYEDWKNGLYFGFGSYLPPGKYKVSVMIDKDMQKVYSPPIQTNTAAFEVVENDNTDKVILELTKKKNYREALEQFPNSSYEEYLTYFDLLMYLGKYDGDRSGNKVYSDTDTLLKKYDAFFSKYPNSLYNLNDAFITGYFSANCKKLEGIDSKKNELMNKYRGTLLEFTLYDLTRRNKLQNCY